MLSERITLFCLSYLLKSFSFIKTFSKAFRVIIFDLWVFQNSVNVGLFGKCLWRTVYHTNFQLLLSTAQEGSQHQVGQIRLPQLVEKSTILFSWVRKFQIKTIATPFRRMLLGLYKLGKVKLWRREWTVNNGSVDLVTKHSYGQYFHVSHGLSCK